MGPLTGLLSSGSFTWCLTLVTQPFSLQSTLSGAPAPDVPAKGDGALWWSSGELSAAYGCRISCVVCGEKQKDKRDHLKRGGLNCAREEGTEECTRKPSRGPSYNSRVVKASNVFQRTTLKSLSSCERIQGSEVNRSPHLMGSIS
ncbi:hypothetical protein EYF80_022055 [Liparis tanakae]|uniref:Secreted protein n=1 Tax=Liparis tanakae TaxID=230148 RepID=A0A4Z2HPG2_9TELE|nr:hypothetical protein EYF80_022055 [Liparis tanakae]